VNVSSKIIILYVVSLSASISVLVWSVVKDIKPRYREAVEESVVDTVNVLAALIEENSKNSVLTTKTISTIVDKAVNRKIKAEIYGRTKSKIDLRVYVTDAKGILLYHSFTPEQVGSDYSKWIDVNRTLSGKYGARATRDIELDSDTSVLFSAAPIIVKGQIIGVVSVGKPVTLLNQFMSLAKLRIISLGILIMTLASIFTILVLSWISRPLKKLLQYVREVRDNKRVALPKLGNNEVGELGSAVEEMRKTIEGRRYVENYVQTLTHEIKSPLSVIQGAGELLAEHDIPEKARRFTSNIISETRRIENLVNRLLDLSSLENRDALENTQALSIEKIAKQELEKVSASLEKKCLKISTDFPTDKKSIYGEEFLLNLAIRNILQNAIDFTPKDGDIKLKIENHEDSINLSISDSGPGAPDWALSRLTEKFFSLPRAETNRKSSGLGLSIVKAITELHGGSFACDNSKQGGFTVRLSFPYNNKQS